MSYFACWSLLVGVLWTQEPAQTPNTFYSAGQPSFILGTQGDVLCDRSVNGQARFIRQLFFPEAPVFEDHRIQVTKGAKAWPKRPIVYGGPHVNLVLRQLSTSLPFQMEAGKLTIGGQVFEGDEYRLITVVPARVADEHGPGYPEFLLFAGTGSPGITEINALHHGAQPILIADRFGPYVAGEWRTEPNGRMRAMLNPKTAPRRSWQHFQADNSDISTEEVHFYFPETIRSSDYQQAAIDACLKGVRSSLEKLHLKKSGPLHVYFYASYQDKAQITGKRGDGHADAATRCIHVIAQHKTKLQALQNLIAHESTHVVSHYFWGPPGSSFLGEGLAVWAAGGYGGQSLRVWQNGVFSDPPPLESLLGRGFRQYPEQMSYPLAGCFVEVAMEQIGLEKFKSHIWPALPSQWNEVCQSVGTSMPSLEKSWRKHLRKD